MNSYSASSKTVSKNDFGTKVAELIESATILEARLAYPTRLVCGV